MKEAVGGAMRQPCDAETACRGQGGGWEHTGKDGGTISRQLGVTPKLRECTPKYHGVTLGNSGETSRCVLCEGP